MAMVADEERRMISKRTKGRPSRRQGPREEAQGGNRGSLPVIGDKGRAISLATRQAKAKSRAADLAPIIADLRASGSVSLQQIAEGLNAKGIGPCLGWHVAPRAGTAGAGAGLGCCL